MPRYTITQNKILKILSDGKPHSPKEILPVLDKGSKLSSVPVHISRIRQRLPNGEDILCEYVRRKRLYRWVRLISWD